jgi:hypothetical protein
MFIVLPVSIAIKSATTNIMQSFIFMVDPLLHHFAPYIVFIYFVLPSKILPSSSLFHEEYQANTLNYYYDASMDRVWE